MTNYCAWPDIPEFARPHFPIVPLAMLEKSVDNLAALAGAPDLGSGVTGVGDILAIHLGLHPETLSC